MNCVDKTCVNFKFTRFNIENKLTLPVIRMFHKVRKHFRKTHNLFSFSGSLLIFLILWCRHSRIYLVVT